MSCPVHPYQLRSAFITLAGKSTSVRDREISRSCGGKKIDSACHRHGFTAYLQSVRIEGMRRQIASAYIEKITFARGDDRGCILDARIGLNQVPDWSEISNSQHARSIVAGLIVAPHVYGVLAVRQSLRPPIQVS